MPRDPHKATPVKNNSPQRWIFFQFEIQLTFLSRYLAYPIALALSLAMFTLSLMVPSELSTEILLGLLFWAGRCWHPADPQIRPYRIFCFSHDLRDWGKHFEEWSWLCRPATLGPDSTTSNLAFDCCLNTLLRKIALSWQANLWFLILLIVKGF